MHWHVRVCIFVRVCMAVLVRMYVCCSVNVCVRMHYCRSAVATTGSSSLATRTVQVIPLHMPVHDAGHDVRGGVFGDHVCICAWFVWIYFRSCVLLICLCVCTFVVQVDFIFQVVQVKILMCEYV